MRKDVAIIGASATGLLTAKKLADHGMDVKIFEASEQIDSTPRSLIVTGHLPKVLGPLYQSSIVNVIHRFELYANGRVANISLKHPDLVIERSKLLSELEAQAKQSGVEIITNHRFLNLKSNGKQLAFSTANNSNGKQVEQYTHILVGADGTSSRVARSGGWPEPTNVFLVQAVVKLPEGMPSDSTRVWFLPELTPYFFWLIPHSSTHGVLGLIAEKEEQGQMHLEQFLENKGLVPIEIQSAMTPLYTRWVPVHRKIGQGDVYLVGDAAGHVKTTTVGGVVTGFRGALNVVDCILKNRNKLNYNGLRRELDFHNFIRKNLHCFTQDDYVKLLDMLTPLAKRSLASFNRDESVKLLFHLFWSQPKLLLIGLQTILRNKLPLFES